MLTLTDVKAYLGPAATATDSQVLRALDAEQAHQVVCCRVPDSTVDPAAAKVLEEALLRRVAVNLARRGLPLGMQMSDVGAARISSSDPEVRRLEGPYRKLTVG